MERSNKQKTIFLFQIYSKQNILRLMDLNFLMSVSQQHQTQVKEVKKENFNVVENTLLGFLIMIKMVDEIVALTKSFSQMTKNAAEMVIS